MGWPKKTKFCDGKYQKRVIMKRRKYKAWQQIARNAIILIETVTLKDIWFDFAHFRVDKSTTSKILNCILMFGNSFYVLFSLKIALCPDSKWHSKGQNEVWNFVIFLIFSMGQNCFSFTKIVFKNCILVGEIPDFFIVGIVRHWL